jgi:DNA-binding NarL/FixJ family response regulator
MELSKESLSANSSKGPTSILTQRFRLLLVEDHPIVSSGLANLIAGQPDLLVCGIAADKATALRCLENLRPDLVILDLTLPDVSGLDLLKEMKTRSPGVRVLVLSMHDEMVYAPAALRAGASGYIMKEECGGTLVRAIRAVLNGGTFYSNRVIGPFLRALARGRPVDPRDILSSRQMVILKLIADGIPTRQIAVRLRLSVKTVESHRAHMKEKLGVETTSDLVRHALELAAEDGKNQRWFEPPDEDGLKVVKD